MNVLPQLPQWPLLECRDRRRKFLQILRFGAGTAAYVEISLLAPRFHFESGPTRKADMPACSKASETRAGAA